jgi:integrase
VAEVERLLKAAQHGRYGHRDATLILVAFRHGLRAAEICDLEWSQVEFGRSASVRVRRVKNGTPKPSRAYLKLWELFTLIGEHPRPGELCLDLGSSPGGWTWVLQRLGARVVFHLVASKMGDRLVKTF